MVHAWINGDRKQENHILLLISDVNIRVAFNEQSSLICLCVSSTPPILCKYVQNNYFPLMICSIPFNWMAHLIMCLFQVHSNAGCDRNFKGFLNIIATEKWRIFFFQIKYFEWKIIFTAYWFCCCHLIMLLPVRHVTCAF